MKETKQIKQTRPGRHDRARKPGRHGRRHANQPVTARPAFSQQGILVEKPDGEMIMQEAPDEPLNPASALKLATTLFALRSLGANYRFVTEVWTNGECNPETGVLTGNLYISGRDFSLRSRDVQDIARDIIASGVTRITGNIYIAPTFTIDFASASASAKLLKQEFAKQSLAVTGASAIGATPAKTALLTRHQSGTLVQIVKVMLSYSSNYMAERLGAQIGGASGLQRSLVAAGVNPVGLKLSSTCGLGINRVSPRALMLVLRALIQELAQNNLTLTDILPVAGIDPGTLSKRYASSPARGSVAAKTGTLVQTDSGASALVGELRTKSGGTLLFVILHNRGQVSAMRTRQDAIVAQVQTQLGGPSLLDYLPKPLLFNLGHA